MSSVVAWLEAELARVEETARMAADGAGSETWVVGEQASCECCAHLRTSDGGLLCAPDDRYIDHMALHDPAAVLRRVAADRLLLADLLAEKHLVVDGDCWFTCSAATEERDGGECCDDGRRGGSCDCGRDARVERRVQLLAEAYGWTEAAHG